MQLYSALLLCIMVLSLTGGLSALRGVFGLSRMHSVFFALSMLVLSRFDLNFSTETRMNLCAITLPSVLAIWARDEEPGVGALSALTVFTILAFVAEKVGVFAGAQNGLLTGFIAGSSAAALATTPKTAFAVSSAVPLCATMLSSVYDMATGRYVQIDLTLISIRDAQMISLFFAGILLCMYAVARAEGVAPKPQED